MSFTKRYSCAVVTLTAILALGLWLLLAQVDAAPVYQDTPPTPTRPATTPTVLPATDTPEATVTPSPTPTPTETAATAAATTAVETPIFVGRLVDIARNHLGLITLTGIAIVAGVAVTVVTLVLRAGRDRSRPDGLPLPSPEPSLPSVQPDLEPKGRACRHCGYLNRDQARVCSRCGQPMHGEPAPKVAPQRAASADASAAGATAATLPLSLATRTEVTQPLSHETRPLARKAGPEERPAQLPSLEVGTAIGEGRFAVTQLVHSSRHMNRYRVQAQKAILVCAQADCGAENPADASFCEKCGESMAGIEPLYMRYWLKETTDQERVRAEWDLVTLGLDHPNLLRPHAAFLEEQAAAPRYYIVLDDLDLWQRPHQLSRPIELALVLDWGIDLAQGLAAMHQNQIVFVHEPNQQSVAVVGRKALWADLSGTRRVPPEEWTQRGTQFCAQDTRWLAALLYNLLTGVQVTGPLQFDPSVRLETPQATQVFGQALGEFGYPSEAELAQALRDLQAKIRHPEGMDVYVARISDVGRERELDEDSILTLELGQVYRSASTPLGIYVLADGMGGHQGGDLASRLAVREIGRRAVNDLLRPALDGPESSDLQIDYADWLKDVVQQANKAVYDQRQAVRTDMGTTLVIAVVDGATAHIAHVGDSRAYLIHDREIAPLTRDHSLVQNLIAAGRLTPEEARDHPQRGVIYRNIGDKSRVEPDLCQQALAAGDVLLLCCDGVSDDLTDEEIRQIVLQAPSLAQASHDLIDAANNAGGSDNISAVLIGVEKI